MASVGQDFTMHAGDTKDVTVSVVDGDGSSVTLTGATIVWKMARKVDETALLTKTTTAGDITISGADFSFTLAASDTASLDAGQYYHEAEVTDSSSDVATVTTGIITIETDLV